MLLCKSSALSYDYCYDCDLIMSFGNSGPTDRSVCLYVSFMDAASVRRKKKGQTDRHRKGEGGGRACAHLHPSLCFTSIVVRSFLLLFRLCPLVRASRKGTSRVEWGERGQE